MLTWSADPPLMPAYPLAPRHWNHLPPAEQRRVCGLVPAWPQSKRTRHCVGLVNTLPLQRTGIFRSVVWNSSLRERRESASQSIGPPVQEGAFMGKERIDPSEEAGKIVAEEEERGGVMVLMIVIVFRF